MPEQSILRIRDLSLYNTQNQPLVENISLTLNRGEALGLVGESGSGKTLTLKSIMNLLPEGIRETCGEKRVAGRCAMIFQDPVAALDPLWGVFSQLCEVLSCRRGLSRDDARREALALFRRLSLPEELARRDRLPRHLSGGQCQRAVIALALACDPEILLCDEPTTALDVSMQKQTVELLKALSKERGFSMLFVTHNLAVAAQVCGRLAVMRRGRIVETGETGHILRAPEDPYTKTLIGAILDAPRREV